MEENLDKEDLAGFGLTDELRKEQIYKDVYNIINNYTDFTIFFENKEKNIDEITNNIHTKVDKIIESVLDDYNLEGDKREDARKIFGNIDDITDEIVEDYLEEGKEFTKDTDKKSYEEEM